MGAGAQAAFGYNTFVPLVYEQNQSAKNQSNNRYNNFWKCLYCSATNAYLKMIERKHDGRLRIDH